MLLHVFQMDQSKSVCYYTWTTEILIGSHGLQHHGLVWWLIIKDMTLILDALFLVNSCFLLFPTLCSRCLMKYISPQFQVTTVRIPYLILAYEIRVATFGSLEASWDLPLHFLKESLLALSISSTSFDYICGSFHITFSSWTSTLTFTVLVFAN